MVALLRLRARDVLVGMVFLGIFLVLFWPALAWMAERFDAPDSFYSHGWLVPLASAWLIWQRRDALKRLTPCPSYAGLGLLIASVTVHVLATWWRVHWLSGLAMLGSVWGLVWTLWGRAVLQALRAPLFFLLFMVPLPSILLIATSFRLKLIAASLATHLLPFLGIAAHQAGSMIQVPGVSIVIDDACSGLRSLITLIALSTLWTTFLPPSVKRWQRWTIIASSIPIALAANMVRILLLVLLAAIYGPQVASGFIHFGSGVVVFGVALASLAWLSQWLLQLTAPEAATPS